MLEAGRSDFRIDPFIHMPAALPIPIGNRLYDWKYESEPEPFMGGRRVFHARGKILGGSSSINGMIFQRGNPMDYERWAADPGMETWDYLHCLPYFKRMETCLAGADDWRGGERPARARARPGDQPAVRRVLRGRRSRPATPSPTTSTATARRASPSSTATCTAVVGCPPRGPTCTRCMERRTSRSRRSRSPPSVVFEGKRAVGGRVHSRGSRSSARPAPTRSSSAAARSTPRSCSSCPASANADDLEALGVDGRPRPPGVGENLQDHLEVYIQYASKQPVSIAPGLRWRNRPKIGFDWLFFRKGLGATNHFEGGGFARSNEDVDYPNLMFHFLPVAIRYDGSAPTEGHGYQVHIGPMYADTRGSVKIKSTDPTQAPRMLFNYLSTPTDRKEWVEAIRVARDILNQPAFAPFNDGELSPGPASRPTRRSSTGSPRTPRPPCTRRAPRRWASTTCP